MRQSIKFRENIMNHTTILALDLGTTTGWALKIRDGQIAHGFVSFKSQRFEGGGMRYLRFKHWLAELPNMTGEINAVYFEEVRRHAGVDAAHVYGGLMATLTTWCEHHASRTKACQWARSRSTHRQRQCRQGRSHCCHACPWSPVTDDNEADALAILHWAIDTQEV
jgi:hypothetical protein